MTSGRSDLVDIDGVIVHETELAVLFSDGTRQVWLPKAAVEIAGDRKSITMPEALALEKELI